MKYILLGILATILLAGLSIGLFVMGTYNELVTNSGFNFGGGFGGFGGGVFSGGGASKSF